MRYLSKVSPKQRRVVAVAIRLPKDGQDKQGTFVLSLSDVAKSADVYARVQNAEVAYRDVVITWRRMLNRVQASKSDPVLRWRLADGIVAFQDRLRTNWQLDAANYRQAVARELAISKSALGYLYRLREVFSLKDLRSLRLNWSKIQELLDIRDPAMMKKGIVLIRKGELRFDSQVREFKRKANYTERRV